MLNLGLYEQVVNKLIRDGLDQLDAQALYVKKDRIDEAKSVSTLAQYMATVVKFALAGVRHEDMLHHPIPSGLLRRTNQLVVS